MKKIIIILLLMVSVTAGAKDRAKEIASNKETGLTLVVYNDLYSIKGDLGAILLGDLKTSRNLMWKIDKCFAQKSLDLGEPEFKVGEDETGMYVIKAGVGVIKIRPVDATKFLAALESIIIKEKAGKVWDIIKE